MDGLRGFTGSTAEDCTLLRDHEEPVNVKTKSDESGTVLEERGSNCHPRPCPVVNVARDHDLAEMLLRVYMCICLTYDIIITTTC